MLWNMIFGLDLFQQSIFVEISLAFDSFYSALVQLVVDFFLIGEYVNNVSVNNLLKFDRLMKITKFKESLVDIPL